MIATILHLWFYASIVLTGIFCAACYREVCEREAVFTNSKAKGTP